VVGERAPLLPPSTVLHGLLPNRNLPTAITVAADTNAAAARSDGPGVASCLRPRHLYEINDGVVEGAIAADAEIRARRGDQRLGVRQDKSLGNRCGSARQFRRQIFALVRIEHGEPLEEWHRVGLVSVPLRPLPFLIGHKAIRIHDGGAMLALADVPADAERLAEREPILATEAVLDHRTPKDEHVDPRVLAVGRRILRHGERRFRCHRPPRLNPGDAAGLELCDDRFGDFLV
jgi:hypothetical protein